MSIHIKFFARLREMLGKNEITIELEGEQTIEQIWLLATDNTPMPSNTLCAINMEYVDINSLVSDGDEIAFFPPVTGG